MQTNKNDYGEIWKDDNKKLLFYLSKKKKKKDKKEQKINTDKIQRQQYKNKIKDGRLGFVFRPRAIYILPGDRCWKESGLM